VAGLRYRTQYTQYKTGDFNAMKREKGKRGELREGEICEGVSQMEKNKRIQGEV
jgi:hypothetical protein